MKEDIHGIVNEYPAFNDLLSHTYMNSAGDVNKAISIPNKCDDRYGWRGYQAFGESNVLSKDETMVGSNIVLENTGETAAMRYIRPSHCDEEFGPSYSLNQRRRPSNVQGTYRPSAE